MAVTTNSQTAKLTLPTDEQIVITREFDAPRHLVYRAYTTPDLVKRWFHAKRGTVTIADIDLRVGGTWRYVMVTDSGEEVAFHGEYRELVPDERIVTTEVYEGSAGAGARPGGREHGHPGGGRRADEVDARDPVPEPGGPGRDRRLRDGGGAAGRARPHRGAGRLPPLSVGDGRRASARRAVAPAEPFLDSGREAPLFAVYRRGRDRRRPSSGGRGRERPRAT